MAESISQQLSTAIYNGDCATIDALVRAGLDVNTISPTDKWNFLHRALLSVTHPPNPAVVAHLIRLGVDVNAKDRHLWTPLHFAARTNNAKVVELLLNAGAEVDPVDDQGVTPLHRSIFEQPCNPEVVELLLAAGANPDVDRGNGTIRRLANIIANPGIEGIRELLDKYSKKCSNDGQQNAKTTFVKDNSICPVDEHIHIMKYFYFDSKTNDSVASSAAIEGRVDDIISVWNSLSRQSGSFLGIWCQSGIALQFMWEDSKSVIIDIPFPDRGGSLTKSPSFQECRDCIADVCSGGDPKSIPGLRLESWS